MTKITPPQQAENEVKRMSLKQAWRLIRSDYYRHTGKTPTLFDALKLIRKNTGFAYTFWWRLGFVSGWPLLRALSRRKKLDLRRRYGLYISDRAEASFGLYLRKHAHGVMVHSGVKLGNNCDINTHVEIGAPQGGAVLIGKSVYVGPYVRVSPGVEVGHNSVLLYGAAVKHDVPPRSKVCGSPAQVVPNDGDVRFVRRRW